MRICLVVAVLLGALGIEVSAAKSDSNLTAMIRADLESEFRQQFDLGFQSFRCDFGDADSLPPEFECEAVDDDGDRYAYRVWQGNDKLPGGIKIWQPITQLYPQAVSWLRAPIDEFLSALEDKDPTRRAMTLHPELVSSIQSSETWNELTRLLDAIGPIAQAEPALYSSVDTDVHVVEYRIVGEQAELVGRFRLQGPMDNPPQVTAFLILPIPGSRLHASQLAETASRTLSPLLGQAITEVRMALESLSRSGDVVEGDVVLTDGATIAVRAEQSAPATDFDRDDYRFQILEASWLVSNHLASTSDIDAKVTCPDRTVPDGGSLVCTAEYKDGSQRFELRRRGGEHRLMPSEG